MPEVETVEERDGKTFVTTETIGSSSNRLLHRESRCEVNGGDLKNLMRKVGAQITDIAQVLNENTRHHKQEASVYWALLTEHETVGLTAEDALRFHEAIMIVARRRLDTAMAFLLDLEPSHQGIEGHLNAMGNWARRVHGGAAVFDYGTAPASGVKLDNSLIKAGPQQAFTNRHWIPLDDNDEPIKEGTIGGNPVARYVALYPHPDNPKEYFYYD